MSVTEVTSKSIEVGVKNSTGFMSKQRRNIGKTIISLATFDVTKTLTEWCISLLYFQNIILSYQLIVDKLSVDCG